MGNALDRAYEAGFGSPLRYLIRHPLRFEQRWASLRRDPGRFAQAFGIPGERLQEWLEALEPLPGRIASTFARTGRPLDRSNFGMRNVVLYLAVRAFRPQRLVETGVEYGFSTAYLLQGLADNRSGALVSIDLPTTDLRGHLSDGRWDGAHVDAMEHTGAAIPEGLRDRWTLRLGDSRDLLPQALSGGAIDLFFHDSDHAAAAMTREYAAAWEHLTEGGCLLSDDINLNRAFEEFAEGHGRRPYTWAVGRRGLLKR